MKNFIRELHRNFQIINEYELNVNLKVTLISFI